MNYTLSDSFSTDAGTGHRLHDDDKAIPTVVSADDMNMVIWSLMEVINAAGIAPAQFDAAVPGTYTKVLAALRSAGVFQTATQFDNTTRAATTAFVKRQGSTFAYQTNLSISTTLTAAQHVGAMVLGNAAVPITLTLPLASTVASGGCIAFQNAGTAAATLSRQGTNVIYVGSGPLTGVTVRPGEYVLFETDGFNWTASGTGVLRFAGSFGASLAPNGHQELPSGLLMQWGSVASANLATTTTSFPIAFPNGAPFQVYASGYNISGGIQAYVTTNDATDIACSFNAFFGNAGSTLALAGAGQVLIKYFAFGR